MVDGVRPPRRAARQGLQEACRSWTFADDSTAEDIEGILKELSEYIEHEV